MNIKITATTLKWIAIITMMIDHAGAVLFNDYSNHPEYIILRIIGRIAFPIFAYLIVQGYLHTKNIKKYALRLFAFALISEVPFDLAFKNTIFDFDYQNVFFTLFIGLIALWAFDTFRKKNAFLAMISVYALGMLAYMLKTDYDIFGVILIFLIYSAGKSKKVVYFWIAAVNLIMAVIFMIGGGSYLQIFALLSIPFIAMYNGEKGSNSKIMQYVFYIIYPGHILLLYFLKQIF